MDQTQQVHKVPWNLPNQQQVLYALSELQLSDLDHLKQLYVRDTKVNP
jgi:hypothetical protein